MKHIKIGTHDLFKCRSAWGSLNGVDVYSVDSSFCCPECAGETFTLHHTDYSDIKCRQCGEPILLREEKHA